MSDSPIISVTGLSKSFGVKPLFSGISLAIGERERVALIGPNGSGKSTLLKMLAGIEEPEEGEVRARGGLRISYIAQEDRFDGDLTVNETLERALVEAGHDSHGVEGMIEVTCGRFGFADKNAKVAGLSGGWRKRLAIARGVISEPELLLLDEPTNHLDISGVLWLEEYLQRSAATLLFVSHDRYFIEHLAGRVVELDRRYPRGFYSSNGGYAEFLEGREAYLSGLNKSRETLANRVRREVAWLRQGAKARTTKSKHRSEQALKLQVQLERMDLEERSSALEFSASNRRSRDLIIVDRVSKTLGGKPLFKDL
ncbi:MAG: ABC-F family ATP-binding cassette domain-containing protein, partial [Deltaproteobacteria bacterium]|nr:ABC-F family ATP-binding cassette domain-containing protein [Deltaproteobacteria bacterium]